MHDSTNHDLTTRLATTHWDCSDTDIHAVTIAPLGVPMKMMQTSSDGTLLYGNGEMERIQRADNRIAKKCLALSSWISNHIIHNR